MKDYISKEAEQYIEVGFSPIIAKNAKKIIEHFKPIIEPLNQRPDIGQNITPYFGGMLLMMYENDLYDWHFDGMDYSKNKELPKIGSNYVYLYYLTKGSPLDIGGWTTINRNFNTLNLNPDILLATIYPKPGKTLKLYLQQTPKWRIGRILIVRDCSVRNVIYYVLLIMEVVMEHSGRELIG